MTEVFIDTRITRLLGVDVPILLGPMAWISDSGLAAAVSNAGGFGILSGSRMSANRLEREIVKTRRECSRPFGVSFSLSCGEYSDHLEMALSQGIRYFLTSQGSPTEFTRKLKDAGATVLHVVNTLEDATEAVREGVDALVVQTAEAGGKQADSPESTLVVLPTIARALDVPVVAAGGIADGYQLAAAVALGADGAMMGTRFLATQESSALPAYKEMVLKAGAGDTVLFGPIGRRARALRTPAVARAISIIEQGHLEELEKWAPEEREKMAIKEANEEEGVFYAGASSAVIEDMPAVPDLMKRTLNEYYSAVGRLSGSQTRTDTTDTDADWDDEDFEGSKAGSAWWQDPMDDWETDSASVAEDAQRAESTSVKWDVGTSEAGA